MNLTDRRERYRAVLAGDQCVHPASVFDPISARIAEDLGFEVGMLAGSIASFTVLGAPDIIVLTLTEFAQQIHRICRAGNLSLMVDADHGYGNALNVKRTVEELESAGVSALTIEDTVLPRRFGTGETELISIEEGVGKMKAALSGRQDPSLVVAGRSSALSVTGVEDAIRRTKAYEAAGVDAMFLSGATTKAEVEAVRAEVKIPLMLGGAGGELSDRDFLSANGVRIALQGHLSFSASVKAIYDTLKSLRDGVAPGDLTDTLATPGMMGKVTRRADYDNWTKEFMN
ncbi:MAG: oxaloacetate decarboxylase [Chloroflexi bacterium]|jgi:carboxyvinyl-carboxyphosphonate phosphorylmutase|nr:oxaloacetate decarboxylase [Chloroflexota bacterium]MAZ64413.1 oxaloacetate decarboxylase [Dehalococcoidia bacterium]MCS5658368.1 isocitrate lyase/phosphoenolpyruvate mutase family protein [Dehalococcoidia bacterium]HAJ01307.1 oxaloacetate decarboxylase [Dehalococcoidia bacterium]|tara:strand:- start:753 stop:1613 length:861 start_codon:yes stop_codon:yes gene_type:complete